MSMNLNELHAAPASRRAHRRLGRGHGSGRGKTAGRGTKGQKARAGGGVPGYFEGGQNALVHRMPVKRGLHFRSVPNKVKPVTVNLRQLSRFAANQTVDLDALVAANLIQKSARKVKVLSDGELSQPLTVAAHYFSASARAKIEAAGGRAVQVEQRPTEEP
ncbi:MAG: 50S ribosomal protein L15 [Chloroflexota bacterium]